MLAHTQEMAIHWNSSHLTKKQLNAAQASWVIEDSKDISFLKRLFFSKPILEEILYTGCWFLNSKSYSL